MITMLMSAQPAEIGKLFKSGTFPVTKSVMQTIKLAISRNPAAVKIFLCRSSCRELMKIKNGSGIRMTIKNGASDITDTFLV